MGTTAQKLEYLGTTKSQLKDMINYGLDENKITSSTTFREYVSSIFNAFLEALRTPDTLFTNLPKKSGTGANITLNDTANAPMRIMLNATELSQDGTPTPSSPQDIHTISGSNKVVVSNSDNTISQEAEVDLGYKNYLDFLNMNMPSVEQTATGERLDNGFKSILTTDGQYKYASWYTKNASEWLGKDMYISCNVKASGGNNGRLLLRWFNTSTNAVISQIANLDATGGTFTMPSTLPNANAQVLISFYANQSSATHSTNDYVEYTNIMVNEGTTAKTYTPYNEAIEYCKIGNYEDKIFKNIPAFSEYDSNLIEGAWYIKKNIGKVEITTFNNKSGATVNNQFSTAVISNILKPSAGTITSSILSNRFTSYSPNYIYGHDIEAIGINTDGSITVGLGLSSGINTLELANQWLGNNQTYAYYPLATPTYTQITGTLAEQLEYVYQKLLSYTGTTNISQVNNDLSFNMSVLAIEQ